MSRIKILIMMLLMSLSLSTSAQNSDNETTTTTCTVSAELNAILSKDENLKKAFDEVNPEDALPFSEESLEEISNVDAFCFNQSTRTMMLWGSNYEEDLMVWGPGLRYAFLAALKTGRLEIVPTTFVPESKSTTVWTPMGKVKVKCYTKGKNKTTFYRVKR